jgi:hypothetical protein
MVKRMLVALLLSAAGLLAPLSVRTGAQATPAPQVQYQECIVYITRTGQRYHVDGCRYLRQSRIAISKQRAESAGYTPCRVCGGSDC